MQQFRPTRFEILPLMVKNLLIINSIVFLAQNVTIGETTINEWFALHTWQSPFFKPWQFVTHMFMHGNFEHLFSNMLALWMFGSILENLWGPKRFLTFYMICGLGAALCHMVVLYVGNEAMLAAFNNIPIHADSNNINLVDFLAKYDTFQQGDGSYPYAVMVRNTILAEATLGASGAVFGCLAAFAYLFPNTYIYLYFFIPVKAKWMVLLYAGFEFFAGIRNSAGDPVAHFAHLGGALVGFLLVYFWNKNNRKNFF
ncbi:MAG: rhomboid family intramembrane serine protease [Chitinophagaceae bacterium]